MQPELLDGLLRRRRIAINLFHAVEEQVTLGQGRLPGIEKTQFRLAGEGNSARPDQAEAILILILRQEDGEPVDAQGFGKAVGNLLKQAFNVELGGQVAGEFQQGAAVVIALAIKEPVHPLLGIVDDRLKEHRGQNNRHHPGSTAVDGRERRAQEVGGEGDGAEVESHDSRGRQGVRNAPPEDDVDVHQPVADDGITKRHGEDRQK